MTDLTVKLLVGAGLAVQGVAIALGFTSLGWRWPISGATAAVGLGILVIQAAAAPPRDSLGRGLAVFAALALASAASHAASASPIAAWAARIFFGIEMLGLFALLVFLLTFRLKRLW